MTTKEAKEYLLQIRGAKKEVQCYQALKQQAFELACSVTAQPDKLAVVGGKGGDVFAQYVQYTAMLDEKVNELYDLQNEVTCTIARIPERRHRELLLSYYVEGLTLEQVAIRTGYSWRQIERLHADALKFIASIMS